jgi:hypothetical protein
MNTTTVTTPNELEIRVEHTMSMATRTDDQVTTRRFL